MQARSVTANIAVTNNSKLLIASSFQRKGAYKATGTVLLIVPPMRLPNRVIAVT